MIAWYNPVTKPRKRRHEHKDRIAESRETQNSHRNGFSLSGGIISCSENLVRTNWGVGGTSRAAIVATEPLDYGLSRMYGLLLDLYTSSEVRVFNTKKEALERING